MPQVALEALPGLALDRRVNTESTLMNNEAAGQTAAEKTAHGLTCNLDAISAQEKPRYTELFESLRHAIRDKRELPDGTRSSWTRLNLPWTKHSN